MVQDEAHGLSHSGVVAKRALQVSSSPDISSSLGQWLAEGFIFPTGSARLFSEQVSLWLEYHPRSWLGKIQPVPKLPPKMSGQMCSLVMLLVLIKSRHSWGNNVKL